MIYGIPLFLLLLLICRILSICYHHWPDAITYDFEYIHACHFSVFLTIKNILTPPVTGTCRQMINAYKNYIYIALFSASLFLQCHLEFSQKKKRKKEKEKLLMVIVIVIINILLLVSFLFAYFRLSTPNHILVNQKWNLLLLLVVRMLLFCIFCIGSPYSEGWTHFCLHLRVWWGLFCCIGFVLILSNMNVCSRINSTVHIIEHREALRTSNALEILSQYPSEIVEWIILSVK